MQADHIVKALLDGTEDVMKHLGRLAVNPAYEFEDAITNKKHLHKTYPAPKEWAYDLEIDIKPPSYDFVKTAWITIRYKRKDPSGTPKLHSGGYAAYKIEDAKKVAGALHQLLIVSRNPVSDHDMNSMYFNLVSLRKQSRNPRMDKKTHGYFRESEGIVRDLLAGAIGFGSFMKRRASNTLSFRSQHLAAKWDWSKDWNHAGEVTMRVYDFGRETERPDSMTISMEWALLRGPTKGSHVEINLWDITPAKKVKIVYVLRDAVQQIEKEAAEMEETMRTIHTYPEDEEMKVRMERIFNKVSNDTRRITDGLERI